MMVYTESLINQVALSRMVFLFYPKPGTSSYYIIDKASGSYIGVIQDGQVKELNSNYSDNESIILLDFAQFNCRPEARLCDPVDLSIVSTMSELKDRYIEKLLAAVSLRGIRQNKDTDSYMPKLEQRLSEWILSTDFFEAPASTQYHECHEHGLLEHSLKVFNNCLRLAQAEPFSSNIDLPSACMCALVHDWCKINLYESYLRNVKDEATGKWSQVKAYRHNDRTASLGHGVSSMFLISKFINLSLEEAAAIRWHMGHWRVADSEVSELQRANEEFPTVHLIQFADQLSITSYT